jgi:hypothetical protein
LGKFARFAGNIPHSCHKRALLGAYPHLDTLTLRRSVMEMKRKLAMAIGTLALALGAGHLMQNGLGGAPEQMAAAPIPQGITPLAAGLGSPEVATPAVKAPMLPEAAFGPPAPDVVAAPEVVPEMADQAAVADAACPLQLDVMAMSEARLDLTLIAPCRPSERVVIRHGGLAVTAMTSPSGSLFTTLPGLEARGQVSVYFSDGVEANGAEALPDLAMYRRFAVQWVADDAFALNAFENGAEFGTVGHVSAANPARRLPNVPVKGGYLTVLGDQTAPLPMMAQVYTFPVDLAEAVDLTIEAEVTEATCNRELLGEVLFSEAGSVTKTDLTMATPDCDAIGDVLVLNNPLPDLKLAAAN